MTAEYQHPLQRLAVWIDDTGADFGTATKQIKLLSEYAWLRQLGFAVTFDDFLERFSRAVDVKNPDDLRPSAVMNELVPRTKKLAESLGKTQWTAAQVLGILELFVETCEASDAEGCESPSLHDFLDVCAEDFLAGDFDEPEEEHQEPEEVSSDKPEPAFGAHGQPTSSNQEVVVQISPAGRQLKGTITAVYTDEDSGRSYGDFVSDDGEKYTGLAIEKFQLVRPESTDASVEDHIPEPPKQEIIHEEVISLSKEQQGTIDIYLDAKETLDAYAVGEKLQWMAINTPLGNIDLEIINAEPKPVLCPYMTIHNEHGHYQVLSLRPRENLLGTYDFAIGSKICRLIVKSKDD